MKYEVLSVTGDATIRVTPSADRQRLKSFLTLENRFSGKELVLYKELGGDLMSVPRGLVPNQADNIGWGRIDTGFVGKLRRNQSNLIGAYFRHIENSNGGIISSPTGTGKTVMGINILSILDLKTLIIVPTSLLMKQWVGNLKTFSDLRTEDIGLCYGDVCDFDGKKVVIGMIHSLCKGGRYPENFYKSFGLCIWDEIHRLGAPTFSASASLYHSKYRLGLSATPRREDGMAKVFFYHIGSLCAPTPPPNIKPRVIVTEYTGQDAGHNGCVWNGKLSLGQYFTRLSGLYNRNMLIAGMVSEAYRKGRYILMLSDRLIQIERVHSLLEMYFDVSKEDIGICTGKKRIGTDRKILLATYGVAGLGMDIPDLSVLIMATPRVDVEQAVGRILRGKSKDTPVVIDIIDVASSIMKNWGRARLKRYKKFAGEIKYL